MNPSPTASRTPLLNRVTPTGEIEALPFRGDLMGNRGVLHDGGRNLVRPWALGAWLICRTSFKDRHRKLMAPNRYTELFFLDEVHALAAGHRPCHECRRAAFRAFLSATGHPGAAALDRALAAERLTGAKGMRRALRAKRTHEVAAGDVPVGAMVLAGRTPFARSAPGFIAWDRDEPGGYAVTLRGRAKRDAATLRAMIASRAPLAMLTPPTSAAALARGYAPHWHASADAAERIAA